MNRYIKMLSSFLLIFIIGTVQALAAQNIPDVPKAHWANKQIHFCVENGLLALDESGNFNPDAPVMRKEALASVSSGGTNSLLSKSDNDLLDIAQARFSLAIPNAEALNEPLTREELTYLISIAYGLTPREDAVIFEHMADADDVSAEYRGYVSAAVDSGIFYVNSEAFRPQGIVSRSVLAMALARAHLSDKQPLLAGSIFALSLAGIIILFLIFILGTKEKSKKLNNAFLFACLIIFSVLVRLILANQYHGHHSDMNYWFNWGNALYANGLHGIYANQTVDYPPGYLYILYLIGAINARFNIGYIIYKLPPIIFDIIWLAFAHAKAKKIFANGRKLLIFDLLAALSPAVIINSAVWGQVDIIYILFVILTIDAILEGKMVRSYFWYAIAILFKPQALVVAPVLLFGIWRNVLTKLPPKKIILNLFAGVLAICTILLFSIPFGLKDVFVQYGETLASYPYFSVNAFNIYTMLGLNFDFLPAWFSAFNSAIIVLIVIISAICFARGNKNHYFLAGMITFAFYMLSAKIHERYCFPAPILFLMAYLCEPEKRSNIYCFLLTSLTYTVNCISSLACESSTLTNFSWVVAGISAVNVIILIYVIITGYSAEQEKGVKI